MARGDTPATQPKTGQPTLQTVADRVGVSRTTVSNAYSRPDQLTPELRETILAAARELGYAGPDPAARTLRRRRSDTIGVLFSEALTFAFSDPAAVALLRGISEVGAARGQTILLLPVHGDDARTAGAVRDAVVDGFIAYCMPTDDPRLDDLARRNLPTVIVDEPRREHTGFVGIDDLGGAGAVAQHLLDLGHRRFGVVTDRLATAPHLGEADLARQARATYTVNRDRLAGYRAALAAAGVAWASVPVIERYPISPAEGARGAAALLDRPDRPTAILATSDQMALGVLDAARERGIDVPGQLSVAGFDDIDAAGRSHPALTTVRQPLLEKGRVAARLLLDPPAGPEPPVEILPIELVARGSTGPAPRDLT